MNIKSLLLATIIGLGATGTLVGIACIAGLFTEQRWFDGDTFSQESVKTVLVLIIVIPVVLIIGAYGLLEGWYQ